MIIVFILVAFFSWSKKAFDTVNPKILLFKTRILWSKRKSKRCFFLLFITDSNSHQLIGKTLNSNLLGRRKGSVLGLLLFIIFINYLHYAVIHSKVWDFADATNLLFANKSLKKINKFINHDLALINKRLRANKITTKIGIEIRKKREATKRGIAIFRAKNKRITKHLNFRIRGQKAEPWTKVKYLGVILHEHLEWNTHTNNLNTKLNRAIGLLAKIHHYIPKCWLRTLYHALCNCQNLNRP